MGSANQTALRDMFNAFWDYLTAHADFVSLGLKPFSSVKGDILPIEQDGSIAATELPAFYCAAVTPGPTGEELDNAGRQGDIEMELVCMVVMSNPTMHQAFASFSTMDGQLVIQDIIRSQAAQQSGGIIGASVEHCACKIGSVEAVPSFANPRAIAYWTGEVIVHLSKRLTFQ